jgi:hypothetical protein
MRGMVINMEEAKLRTLEQIKAFLDGTAEEVFRVPKGERNQFVERVLNRFGYAPHGRVDKGVLLRYIERMTGLSRQQVTRLVRQYCKDGKLSKQPCAPKQGFTYRYTAADVALLAEMDVLHSTLSGPATKKLMARAYEVFGDPRYERMAGISVSHLYNLRGSKQYQDKRRHWTKTNPTGIPIGQRRAPQPDGMPGYIRIDSGHQGDLDGMKGVYYINAVDCVTQMQFVATCEKISEAYLLPVIGQLLAGFPFVILGFHSDNVRNISITKSQSCWRNFVSNSPNHGHVIPTTMPWLNPRTQQWCAGIWAMRISPNTAPAWSTPSVPISSTLTSTIIGHVSSRKRSRMQREKSARNTATRT